MSTKKINIIKRASEKLGFFFLKLAYPHYFQETTLENQSSYLLSTVTVVSEQSNLDRPHEPFQKQNLSRHLLIRS